MKDTLWLYLSFIIFILSGVSINFFILFNFGVDDLGIFIQIYTFYLIISQLAVFGIHDSAQRNVANNINDSFLKIHIKFSAFLISILFGLIGFLLLMFFSKFIGNILSSPNVGLGLKLASPGILFFAINKVILGLLNGERKIKLFSISQSMRSIFLFIFITILSINGEVYKLSLSFTFTEILLLLFLLLSSNLKLFGKLELSKIKFWIKFHFFYGLKSLPNSFLYESFLKIDVLMLSIFLSDYKVGIYSFAAMFFEGLYQIPTLLRTNSNPVLVSILKKYKRIRFDKFILNLILLSFFVTAFGIIIIIFLYPHLNPLFPDNIVQKSYYILIILCIGLFIYSCLIPLDFIFIQAGMPGVQSVFILVNVVLNIILNLVFIEYFGIYGAAIATTISLIFSGLNLILIMKIKKLL